MIKYKSEPIDNRKRCDKCKDILLRIGHVLNNRIVCPNCFDKWAKENIRR